MTDPEFIDALSALRALPESELRDNVEDALLEFEEIYTEILETAQRLFPTLMIQ